MRLAGDGLEKVIAQSLRKAHADQVPLLAWPLACGSAVAARTHAFEFADGVLRVEVPDAGCVVRPDVELVFAFLELSEHS